MRPDTSRASGNSMIQRSHFAMAYPAQCKAARRVPCHQAGTVQSWLTITHASLLCWGRADGSYAKMSDQRWLRAGGTAVGRGVYNTHIRSQTVAS